MIVDWPTGVITVYKTDPFMAWTGGSIYNMDTNGFRLALKDAEDGEQGICFPDTHRHNTTVLLGGIEYARVLEILAPYTITFDDAGGGWVCNLIGSNNNILDRTNLTGVQVRSNNSAGLVQMAEIQHGIFNGCVTLDTSGSYAGTQYPIGTPLRPVNNLADAMTIAIYRGFGTIRVLGNAVIDSGGDYTGMTFVGESHEKTNLFISPEANVSRCEFYDAKVGGTLDGDAILQNCMIEDLEYVNGEIKECVLKPPGVISLGGESHATFVRCVTECTMGGPPVTIDLGGGGQPLAIRDMSGAILLRNKTGPEEGSAVMAGGTVFLDMTTLTGGKLKIAGVCDVIDWTTKLPLESGMYGSFQLVNNAISRSGVANSVWAYERA